MNAFPVSPQHSHVLLLPASRPYLSSIKTRNPSFFRNSKTLISSPRFLSAFKSALDSSNSDSSFVDDNEYEISDSSLDTVPQSILSDNDVEVEIEIEKLGTNSRRIRSRIDIDSSLQTIWNLLTDYERLADFIPGLAVSQLLQKREGFARIFQIGQQNLAFGLKFEAKGIVDCYEKDLENLPSAQRRDIEFKMIEGDFKIFQGMWSIEQVWMVQRNCEIGHHMDSSVDQEFHTTLSYVVDVEPKLWLPVGLVEGRLCREIKVNLLSIREEAQKAGLGILPTC